MYTGANSSTIELPKNVCKHMIADVMAMTAHAIIIELHCYDLLAKFEVS